MDWLDLLAVQGILNQLASAGSWVVQPGTGLTLRIQAQAALSTPRGPGLAPFCGPPLSLSQRGGTRHWLPSPGRRCGPSPLTGAQTSPLTSPGCLLLPTTPSCPDRCLLTPEATGPGCDALALFRWGSAGGSPRTLTGPRLSAVWMLLRGAGAVRGLQLLVM